MRPRLLRAFTIVFGFAALVATSACSSANDTKSAAPGQVDNLGLTHVHGLGIDPSDGVLYAAGHRGVFSIKDGQAERRGDLVQDTMGFTVAGPKRFLGSGHPDIQRDQVLQKGMPRQLGLIESTDQGVTWRGLSLQGQADFHALTFAHNRVFGSNAGQLMVSSDLKTWETRSSVALASIAVSPADAELIIGTTERGGQRSTDGGRTWTPIAGAPALLWVSWDATAGVWGTTANGEVWHSTDAATWTRAGTVSGKTAAIYAHPSGIFVATDQAVSKSTDGGKTFQTLVKTGA